MTIPYDFKDVLCRDRVSAVARRWNLDPILVAAVVMQESGGWPDAWRPEPAWRYYWDVKQKKPFRKLYSSELSTDRAPEDFHSLRGSPEQEWWAQSASWGLMQIMGAVARELGYGAPYLTALCDPFEGLQWGCNKLAQCMNKYAAGGISAYNAGSPMPDSKYERSVLAWRDKLLPLFS